MILKDSNGAEFELVEYDASSDGPVYALKLVKREANKEVYHLNFTLGERLLLVGFDYSLTKPQGEAMAKAIQDLMMFVTGETEDNTFLRGGDLRENATEAREAFS